MKYYKVCKYDYDNEKYKEEWTSFEEALNEKKINEYLEAEKNYLIFASNFYNKYKKVWLSDYEKYKRPKIEGSYNVKVYMKNLKLPSLVDDYVVFLALMQSSLRGESWSLFKNNEAYIMYGHDYYWCIAIDENFDIKEFLQGTNLFAYEWYNVLE